MKEDKSNEDEEPLLIRRGMPRRGLDGLFPPKDAENNVFYQAFLQAGMFEYQPEMPDLEDIFRYHIYPPGSEEPSVEYNQRLANAYRILQIHDHHPGCSVCFNEFDLEGGINDTHNQYITSNAPYPAVHFYHTGYHYEGIMFCDFPRSKLYLSSTHKRETLSIILARAKKENLFANGPIDLMIPETGVYQLAPHIVIPGLTEIWAHIDGYSLEQKRHRVDLIHIDKTGITSVEIPGATQPCYPGEFFRKEFKDVSK